MVGKYNHSAVFLQACRPYRNDSCAGAPGMCLLEAEGRMFVWSSWSVDQHHQVLGTATGGAWSRACGVCYWRGSSSGPWRLGSPEL
jgi:hypothetical protein